MKNKWDEVQSKQRRCNSAKVRRKKIPPRQMLEKSQNAVFFQWFVCRVSRKVRSLKRRVRSHVVKGAIKIARRCGEKHIFKWKCTKHVSFGPPLEVPMSKNCTPVWQEAHFQVKMYKTIPLPIDQVGLRAPLCSIKWVPTTKWACAPQLLISTKWLHAPSDVLMLSVLLQWVCNPFCRKWVYCHVCSPKWSRAR